MFKTDPYDDYDWVCKKCGEGNNFECGPGPCCCSKCGNHYKTREQEEEEKRAKAPSFHVDCPRCGERHSTLGFVMYCRNCGSKLFR